MKRILIIALVLLTALGMRAEELTRQAYTLVSLELPESMRYDAQLSEQQGIHTYINGEGTLMLMCAPATAKAEDDAAAVVVMAAESYGFTPDEVKSYTIGDEPFCYAVRSDGRLGVAVYIDHAEGLAVSFILFGAAPAEGEEPIIPRLLTTALPAE